MCLLSTSLQRQVLRPRGGVWICVRACVRVCPGWGCRGREDETIVGLEPHSRPCAVDYHTAVHMRSKQKQHDSAPHPPKTHTRTHTQAHTDKLLPFLCHSTRVTTIILASVKKEQLCAILTNFLQLFCVYLLFCPFWGLLRKEKILCCPV